MSNSFRTLFPAAAAVLMLLAACGGGGGGGIASAPLPAAQPTPAPTAAPSPGPSPLPARLGLASDQPFATAYASPSRGAVEDFGNGAPRPDQNARLEIRYLASSNTYEVKLPGQPVGRLEPYFSNGDHTGSNTVPAGGAPLPDGRVHLPVPGRGGSPYSYTSFGNWNPLDETPRLPGQTTDRGVFVYGIPTKPSEIPTTGRASFDAAINGYAIAGGTDVYVLYGSARLDFDFAAGRLSGAMNPSVPESGWGGFDYDLGRYEFTQTVYSKGSTSFSGKFDGPNVPAASGLFSGTFTGPNAEELMARFEAPFLNRGVSGELVGVWIGKRGN